MIKILSVCVFGCLLFACSNPVTKDTRMGSCIFYAQEQQIVCDPYSGRAHWVTVNVIDTLNLSHCDCDNFTDSIGIVQGRSWTVK